MLILSSRQGSWKRNSASQADGQHSLNIAWTSQDWQWQEYKSNNRKSDNVIKIGNANKKKIDNDRKICSSVKKIGENIGNVKKIMIMIRHLEMS